MARARYDLSERVDTRDEDFCAGLGARGAGAGRATSAPARSASSGCATSGSSATPTARRCATAAGCCSPRRHAGPGFFDAAHTGVWSLDPDGWVPEHRADLFFRRPGPGRGVRRPRDAPGPRRRRDGWWPPAPGATSTGTPGAADDATVAVTLAETDADLLSGRHVLDTRPLRLPTDGLRSVGVWDPHLVRIDGRWHVGFVSASGSSSSTRRWRPAPTLDDLTLLGADTTRTATEGTTLARASTARGWCWPATARTGPRAHRAAYPVFDLALRQTGRLDAPYPSNIPWPTSRRPTTAG